MSRKLEKIGAVFAIAIVGFFLLLAVILSGLGIWAFVELVLWLRDL